MMDGLEMMNIAGSFTSCYLTTGPFSRSKLNPRLVSAKKKPSKSRSVEHALMYSRVRIYLVGVLILSFIAFKVISKKQTKNVEADIVKPQGVSSNTKPSTVSSEYKLGISKTEYSMTSAESAMMSSSMVVLSSPVVKELRLEDLLKAPAELLGREKHGSLYKVILEDGMPLVVKRIKDWAISSEEFKKRIQKIDEMKHPNVLPAVAFYSSKQEKLAVYKYQQNGSLFKLIYVLLCCLVYHAMNFKAGCKTAVSNIVMALAVMITLLFLTPLFHYTPLVVLSAIIISAMLGLIDYDAAIHLFKVDKFDFVGCICAYLGVVFGSVEIGLVLGVVLSIVRVRLFVARPRTFILGNIPNSMIYRNVGQYPNANSVPGILILHIDAPIYFANSGYLRERISRWINEEEEKLKSLGKTSLLYVILDMSAVGSIDTSGISMLEEVKNNIDRRGLTVQTNEVCNCTSVPARW